jgi:glucosamine--fructose-6-phosphate aminotransferase (isomerizing)
MCGIVGVVTENIDTFSVLMHGLRQLQNRGYDSAGISTIHECRFHLTKHASNDESALVLLERNRQLHANASVGIAHTRWATHGGKTDANSHPHISSDCKFSLVHNGIVDNYKELKTTLIRHCYAFQSDTDSEVIVNLLAYNYTTSKDVVESITKTISLLQGTWGLVILCSDTPDSMYCTRRGSPLLIGMHIGQTDGHVMIVSEQSALSESITEFIVLHDMDICVIKKNAGDLFIETRNRYELKQKTAERVSNTPAPYSHWTLKEIYEQSESVKRTTDPARRAHSTSSVKLSGLDSHMDELNDLDSLILLGCGTSYNAGMCGLHYFKELCNFNCIQVVDGADFTMTDVPKIGRTGLVLISQSGETADLHRCITIAKQNSLFTIGVVNVVDSIIARDVDCVCYLDAGREVAVASTKSFTSQCIVLSLMAVWFSQNKSLCFHNRVQYLMDLEKLDIDVVTLLSTLEAVIGRIVPLFDNQASCFVLGKGQSESIAYEGSLKIKELSYIHCEGYSTSSLKHGPFALLGDNFPVVLIAPDDHHFVKNENAYNEIKARHATVIWITDKDLKHMENVITIPSNKTYNSLLSVIPLQMIAYKLSVGKGINPDMPKNLAKVVTVE